MPIHAKATEYDCTVWWVESSKV